MDHDLSRTSRYVLRKEAIAWQSLEEEGVLVQLEREEVHVANPTAVAIIDGLQAGATLPELVQRVTNAYEVDDAQATADVETFLKVALEAGLIAEESP